MSRAFSIPRPATAFALSPGKKKRPRAHDKSHLDFIRSLPCAITGKRPVEAAHVRYAAPEWGKRGVGTGEKPDDAWALPLSPELHREQHQENERAFWLKYGINPITLALALFRASGDSEAAELILTMARPGGVERR